MKTRLFILSFIAIILITTAYADNFQFHKREHQKPIFESNSLWEAIGYTCVDVEKHEVILTANYVHYINFNNHHAAVFHKTDPMIFIRMGDAENVRAYFIFAMTTESGNVWWSVYEILIEDEDNAYTIMYREMIAELKDLAEGCVRKKDDFI